MLHSLLFFLFPQADKFITNLSESLSTVGSSWLITIDLFCASLIMDINNMRCHLWTNKKRWKCILFGLLMESHPPSPHHGCVQGISHACSCEQPVCSQAVSSKWLLRLQSHCHTKVHCSYTGSASLPIHYKGTDHDCGMFILAGC